PHPPIFLPSAAYNGVVKFVFDNISTLAVNACPPVLVGVGIATSVETAAMLSRRAILRPIGSQFAFTLPLIFAFLARSRPS
ncbi:fumarate hydratase, partial [Escherichia coli]